MAEEAGRGSYTGRKWYELEMKNNIENRRYTCSPNSDSNQSVAIQTSYRNST